jgi:ADP-ribosyl-[dinitrogen reductase] hydrolase
MTSEYSAQRERAVGCLLGLAVGDALGAPVEFCRRDSFEPVSGMCSGGYFKLPAGAWTDDTAMALCLGESLRFDPAVNAQDLLERFCRWASDGENTSTGVCVGIGQNTLRVLGNFHRTGALAAPETSQKSDGNGAAMRLAPVAVRHWNNPKLARRAAVLQSRVTHYSEISAACCEALSDALAKLIGGADWQDGIRPEPNLWWPQEVRMLWDMDWSRRERDSIRSSGYVVHTVEAALWAVDTTSNFRDAVLKAVNLGDDADSVGAVAGQLAGARFGADAIPEEWLSQLIHRPKIQFLASNLFQASITPAGNHR